MLDWKVSATPTEDGGYVLNGTKHFCSGAKGSDLLFVFGVVQDDSPQQGAIDHGQAEETVAGSHDVNREPYEASEQANIDALSM